MHVMPLDTAKTVARFKAGGFTPEQAEVLTYALVDLITEIRDNTAARYSARFAELHQLKMQQEAFQAAIERQAWELRLEARNRETEALERSNKRWMYYYSPIGLVAWTILMALWIKS